MERDTGIIKERDYIVKTDRSPEEIEEAIKKSEEEMKKILAEKKKQRDKWKNGQWHRYHLVFARWYFYATK